MVVVDRMRLVVVVGLSMKRGVLLRERDRGAREDVMVAVETQRVCRGVHFVVVVMDLVMRVESR